MNYDHFLAIGFGAPTEPEEIKPFLKKVAQGRPIPEERLEEVFHHYELIGGSSPYNAQCFEFIEKVRESLKKDSVDLPTYVGMRTWHPFLSETQKEIKGKGYQKGLALLLAPHRSEASCKRYTEDLRQAQVECGTENIEYDFLGAWYEEPLYIQAHADEIQKVLPAEDKDRAIIFTAHSIPVSMSDSCKECQYEKEFKKTGMLIAEKLGVRDPLFAYQSRSGNPRQPWLEPDILSVINNLVSEGKKSVTIVPIGFLCENAEILFDLDIEAKELVVKRGMRYFRSQTVMNHENFVEMICRKIKEQLLHKVI